MLLALTPKNDDSPNQIDGLLANGAGEAEAYLRRRAAR